MLSWVEGKTLIKNSNEYKILTEIQVWKFRRRKDLLAGTRITLKWILQELALDSVDNLNFRFHPTGWILCKARQ
jgi:hypothetical protein